jgi:hypothetical protein
MDEKTFKDRVKKLNEVNKIIEKLDPSIRAESFKILQSYIMGKEKDSGNGDENNGDIKGKDNGKESFFEQFDQTKPSDNALLAAAYLYSQFGSNPFSLKDVEELAGSVGITIPSRCDMTFKAARHKGKILFTQAGRGKYKPTVHGEAFLKKTYKVKKGTKTKEPEADA